MISMFLMGCSLSGPAAKPAPAPSAEPVTAGGAPAAPPPPPAAIISNHVETWPRAMKDKPTGPNIEISLPAVKVTDPAVQAKIDALLVPETLIGDSKASIIDASWVDKVSWKTGYKKADLLDLNVSVEGCAAYCDGYTRALVVDLKTGDAIGVDSFDPAQVPALIARLDRTLQANIAARVKEDAENASIIGERHVTTDDLAGYALSNAGLVFHINFDIPHVAAAATPDNDLLLPWAEVGTYLTATSPLRRAL